VSAALV
jgi:ribonuclease HI